MVTTRLTADCYAGTSHSKRGPGGMYCGQCVVSEPLLVLYNAWLNAALERLGQGDVTVANAVRLMRELEEGDFFLLQSIGAPFSTLELVRGGSVPRIDVVLTRGRCFVVQGFTPQDKCSFDMIQVPPEEIRRMILDAGGKL